MSCNFHLLSFKLSPWHLGQEGQLPWRLENSRRLQSIVQPPTEHIPGVVVPLGGSRYDIWPFKMSLPLQNCIYTFIFSSVLFSPKSLEVPWPFLSPVSLGNNNKPFFPSPCLVMVRRDFWLEMLSCLCNGAVRGTNNCPRNQEKGSVLDCYLSCAGWFSVPQLPRL